MDTTARVREWRQKLKEEGKVPLTIYVNQEEKLRLEDLALTWHCSLSRLVEQALVAFDPGRPRAPGGGVDLAQVRQLIREEVVAHLNQPGVLALAPQAPESPVTGTPSNVTVTEAPQQTTPAPTATTLPPDAMPEPSPPPAAPVALPAPTLPSVGAGAPHAADLSRDDQIRELYEQGQTYKQIGTALGVAHGTINRAVTRLGLPLRPSNRRKVPA